MKNQFVLTCILVWLIQFPAFGGTTTVKSGGSVTVTSQNQGNTQIIVQPEKISPVRTQNCVKETGNGDCREYDYTFSALGMNCTEDCLIFDSFDKCILRNKCQFDQGSKTFVKSICDKIDDFNNCAMWSQEPQD